MVVENNEKLLLGFGFFVVIHLLEQTWHGPDQV
jgi:hypothetical protein